MTDRHLSLSPNGPRLALGRAHEAFGPARRVFAAMTAARLAGPVLWIRGPWAEGAPCPDGVAAFFDPGRIVLVECRRGIEALWAAEEALRSGAAPLVALEADAPPGLTPVRRLTLAAQGGGERPAPPICLILTPLGGAAPAVQTRWRVDPLPGWARGAPAGGDAETGARREGPPRWRLTLLRDKAGPPATWEACGQPPCRALATGPAARAQPQFRRAA